MSGDDMTEYWLCEDCAMWHTNADLSGVDDAERLAQIEACSDRFVIDCGEHAELCEAFSAAPCDACRTRLAGSRHRAFLIGVHYEPQSGGGLIND
jgi:hypothetical protein